MSPSRNYLFANKNSWRVPHSILLKTYVYFLHLPREPFACHTKQHRITRDPLHALEGTCSLGRRLERETNESSKRKKNFLLF